MGVLLAIWRLIKGLDCKIVSDEGWYVLNDPKLMKRMEEAIERIDKAMKPIILKARRNHG